MKTTPETLTPSQIRQLRYEATLAGDDKQVSICNDALCGQTKARVACAAVIADQEAQS